MTTKKIFFISAIFISLSLPIWADQESATSYYKQATKKLELGIMHDAVLDLKKSIQLNNNFLAAKLTLAQVYFESKNYSQALALYEDCLKLDSENIEALNGKAIILTEQALYDQALAYYQKISELSPENLDADYGIALIYYQKGRLLWANRRLNKILKINPFQANALLLAADIKLADDDFSAALKLINKALSTNDVSSELFLQKGDLLYKQYFATKNNDFLTESIVFYKKALAAKYNNFSAYNKLGKVAYQLKDFNSAIIYFRSALNSNNQFYPIYYNLGNAYSQIGDDFAAAKNFKLAKELSPTNNLVRTRYLESLLAPKIPVMFPARISLANEYYEIAKRNKVKHYYDKYQYYLRKALLLNSYNVDWRYDLANNYLLKDNYPEYFKQLDYIRQLSKKQKYQNKFSVAVLKRRKKLYALEGYAYQKPINDDANLLVLNLWPENNEVEVLEGGKVIADEINFTLKQYGRQKTYSLKNRQNVVQNLPANKLTPDVLKQIDQRIKKENLAQPDYLLFGYYHLFYNGVKIYLYLMDYRTGVVIDEFQFKSLGKNYLPDLALAVSKNVFQKIPFKGRVLKVKQKSVVINLGSFNGLKIGDKIILPQNKKQTKKSSTDILLEVISIDANLAECQVVVGDLQNIYKNDYVYPPEKKQARLITNP